MHPQYIAPYLGSFFLSISIPICVFGLLSAPLAPRLRDGRWMRSTFHSGILLFALITACVVLLVGSFLTDNFAIKYVNGYSSTALPTFYKVTGLWAGLDGSILLWTWLVCFFNFVLLARHRTEPAVRPLLPGIQAVMHLIILFFLLLLVYADNPFTLLTGAPPVEGRGLNPLLQNLSMVIHPPSIYLGFTSAAVPFAFAMSALMSKRLDSQWIRQCRIWTITCWFFLTLGNLLGGQWAYVELGWGGFWAWDPVENAAIMPWFTSSAFVHSVIVQERRGMLKVWNMVLVILTFLLTIFGTFLTRSGVVTSVHSFSSSNVGPYFVAFLVAAGIIGFTLLLFRLKDLRPENPLLSWFSKEGSFILNNIVLVACAFTVLWGTMFPSLSEWVTGNRVSVGPPFFNTVMAPLGLLLLFLIGVGPLIAWKKASLRSLKANFLVPVGTALGFVAIVLAFQITRWYAVVSAAGIGFVVAAIVLEFWRGSKALKIQHGHSVLASIGILLLNNGRKYGGYIIHWGVVFMFVGIAGTVYKIEKDFVLTPDQPTQFEEYTLTFKRHEVREDAHKMEFIAHTEVRAANLLRPLVMQPARHFYKVSQQPSTEVAIYHGFFEDVYLTFGAYNETTGEISLRVNLNPLVSFLWLGGMICLMGTFLVLIPRQLAMRVLRPEVTPARPQQEAAP